MEVDLLSPGTGTPAAAAGVAAAGGVPLGGCGVPDLAALVFGDDDEQAHFQLPQLRALMPSCGKPHAPAVTTDLLPGQAGGPGLPAGVAADTLGLLDPLMPAPAGFDGLADLHQQQQLLDAGIDSAGSDGLKQYQLWQHQQQWPGLPVDNSCAPGAASGQQLAVQLAATAAAAAGGASSLAVTAGAGSSAATAVPRTGMQRLHVGMSQLAGPSGIRLVARQAAAQQQHIQQQQQRQQAHLDYSPEPDALLGALASGSSSASNRLAVASVGPGAVQQLGALALSVPSVGAAAQGVPPDIPICYLQLLQSECNFLSPCAAVEELLLEPPVSIDSRLPRRNRGAAAAKKAAAAAGAGGAAQAPAAAAAEVAAGSCSTAGSRQLAGRHSRQDTPAAAGPEEEQQPRPQQAKEAVVLAALLIAERSGKRKPALNLVHQVVKFNAAAGAASAAPDSSSNPAPASHKQREEEQAAGGSAAADGGITSARARVQALAEAVDPICISLQSALLLEGRAAAERGQRGDDKGNGGHRAGQWMKFSEAHGGSSGINSGRALASGGAMAGDGETPAAGNAGDAGTATAITAAAAAGVADGDMVAAAAAAAAAEAAARNASLKVAVEERQYAAKMKLAIEACGDDVRKAEELARQMVEHVYAMRGAAAAQQPQQQPQPGLSAAAFAAEPPFVPPAALVVAAAEHAAGAAAGYTAVTPCGTAAGAATAGGCSGQEPQQVGQAVEDSTAAPAAPAPAAAEPLTGQPRTRQAAKRAAAAAAAASRGDPKRARKQSCKLRDMEVDGAAGSASGGTDEQQQQQQEEEEAEEACDGGGPALMADSAYGAGGDADSEQQDGGAGLAGNTLDKPFYYTHNTTGERVFLTVRMAQQYYHLTMREAAAELGMCGTTLKKFRRIMAIRWPSRQLRSMDALIKDVEAADGGGNEAGGAAEMLAHIMSFRQQLNDNPNLPTPAAIKNLRTAVHKQKHKRKAQQLLTQTQTQMNNGIHRNVIV